MSLGQTFIFPESSALIGTTGILNTDDDEPQLAFKSDNNISPSPSFNSTSKLSHITKIH